MNDTPVNLKDAPQTQAGDSDLAVGSIVGGQYRVLSLLGRGGMGVVYRIEQVQLGREMALKTILPAFASENIFRRFEQEARAAGAIDHANVVKVYEVGMLGSQAPFMVMDLVEGETLAELLKSKVTLSVAEAVALFTQVCFGLAAAHAGGVVHRDIKPSNIMLVKGAPFGTEGSVKVLDFGIAKLVQCEGGAIQALTKTGEIFGSPLYMSPEQCRGDAIDQRSDVYSLGCVLFEALTGTTPFIGENALATMMQHQNSTAPKLKEASLGNDFPLALELILAKMLAKEPEERYSDLAQIAVDLGSVLNQPGAAIPMQGASSKSGKAKSVADGRHHLSPLTVIISVALTACLFALIGYFASTKLSGQTPAPKAVTGAKPVEEIAAVSTVSDFANEMETGSSLREALVRPLNDGAFKVKGIEIDGAGFDAIAEKHGIRDLELEFCNFDEADFKRLRKIGMNLNLLSVRGCPFGDLGASEVAKWANLKHLKLERSRVTDAGFIQLAKLKKLNKIEASDTVIGRAGIEAIARAPAIRGLSVDHCSNIDDAALAPLASSKLDDVDLQYVEIDDAAVKYLAKMPNLRYVRLEGTKVSADGIIELLKNRQIQGVGVPLGKRLTEKQMAQIQRMFPSVAVGHASAGLDR